MVMPNPLGEEDMWLWIMLILCAAIVGYVTLRSKKGKERPPDHYVCDICGERDCLCRKEEEE